MLQVPTDESANQSTDESTRQLCQLLKHIRQSVEGVIFANETEPLGALTGLLAAVPTELSERIGMMWTQCTQGRTIEEFNRSLTHEDRLLLDLVLSMSDDRRLHSSVVGA